MTSEKFQEIIKARANQRVQDKLAKFKSTCIQAAFALTGKNPCGYNMSKMLFSELKPVFATLASDDITKWPKSLWEAEEAAVEKELIAIMDEMQKAFLDASKAEPGENSQMEKGEAA